MARGSKRARGEVDYDEDKDTKRRIALRECSICYTDIPKNRFPLQPHEGVAKRGHSVCFSCFEKHLHAELESKEWDKLSCPDCGQLLKASDIKKLDRSFTDKVEPKVDGLVLRSVLKNEPGWVDCPSSTCKGGALMIDGHIFTCQVCNQRYCFSCQIPMHEGESCSQYKQRIEEDRKREGEKLVEQEQTQAAVEKFSKACPKCHVRLEKSAGCDHFTRKPCGHEFCWVCFCPYRGPQGIAVIGNSAHVDTCSYSPRRLPNYNGPLRDE
ncbi:Uncharacterized protein HII31_04511 [Pseudocercospora fuligena]|uniref:RING-type domain-containing protein n=1 Tax=Pseudocercospora fuligena TaxID=685502 RepID=A0A8H6VJP1_9PEZI|nr:Uncharacterized protein HII31_04511 [Pseudocercospora fuligena]